jgi:hypothetical protein
VLDLLLLAAQWTAEALAAASSKGETTASSAAPQLDSVAPSADVSSSAFKLEVSEEVGDSYCSVLSGISSLTGC